MNKGEVSTEVDVRWKCVDSLSEIVFRQVICSQVMRGAQDCEDAFPVTTMTR